MQGQAKGSREAHKPAQVNATVGASGCNKPARRGNFYRIYVYLGLWYSYGSLMEE